MVNEFCLKMAQKESYLYFLNNDEDLFKDGIPLKSMYDNNDEKGVNASAKGAFALEENTQSKKISNDQELIQSDPTSCPQNQKGNN